MDTTSVVVLGQTAGNSMEIEHIHQFKNIDSQQRLPIEVLKPKNYVRNMVKGSDKITISAFLFGSLHFTKNCNSLESKAGLYSEENEDTRALTNYSCMDSVHMKRMLDFKRNMELLLFLIWHEEEHQSDMESHSTPTCGKQFLDVSILFGVFDPKFDQNMQSNDYYESIFECRLLLQHEYRWISSPGSLSLMLPSTVQRSANHVMNKVITMQKDVEMKEDAVNMEQNNKQAVDKSTRELCLTELLAFILVVLFIVFPVTCANPIEFQPRETKHAKVLSEKILFSETCVYQKFNCPLEERNLRLLLKQCEFTNICLHGKNPVCINAEERAVIICSDTNLRCDAGLYRRAVLDNNKKDMVIIFEEGCPIGKYQPTPSDCYNACYSQHRTFLPERYLIYTTGDNVNPTFVYCNYNNGYINREGNFLINFDEEEEHDQYFCQLVNKSVYCHGKHDQFPLPNGTCVSACLNGEFRDDFDDFKCKQINSKANETTTAIVLSTDIVQKASSYISPTAPGSRAESDRHKDHADDPNSTKTNENATINAVCSVIGVIAGSVILGTCIHKIITGKWFWQTTSCSEGYREVRTNKRIKKNCTTNNFYGDFTITMGTDGMKIERSDGTDESFSSRDPNESLLSDESGTNSESTGSEHLNNNSGEMQEVDGSTTVTVETETDETLSKEIHSAMPLQDRSKPTAAVPAFEPQNSSTNMMGLKV